MTNASKGHPLVTRVVIGALGLLTVLPVLLLLASTMVLSNIAYAEKSSSPSDVAWRTFTILGALTYVVLYLVCGWRVGPGWRRCRAYLAVFSAYTALMLAFMVSGNFLAQFSGRGVLYAVGHNWAVITFIVLLMAYSAVLVRGIVRAGRPSPG